MFAEVGELIGEDLSEPEVPLAGPALGAAGSPESPEFDDGDLPALVREYCWETHNESGHDQAILDRLLQMQRDVPVPQLELERVTSQDLSRLLLQVYLEAAPGGRAQEVAAAFAALDRFYCWCAETQQMEFEAVIRGCQRDLVEQVPRLQAAGLALSVVETGAETDTRLRPIVSRVTHVEGARVEIALEREQALVALDGAGAAGRNLREGDILLGPLRRQADGKGTFVGMVVVMPPIAEGLIG